MKIAVTGDYVAIEKAIQKGEKLAVFTVDGQGNPREFVCAVQRGVTATETGISDTVTHAKEYIEDNWFKPTLRLGDVAKECGVSVSHLCRIFAQEEKTTVNGFILAERMNTSAYLLINTDRSVVDIAAEVGYPDCGYFHKVFKKYFGVTPLSYRTKSFSLT